MAANPPLLPETEILDRLARELPGWSLREGWLHRKFETGGWPVTLMLVNAIAFLSEAADHHPDLEIAWGRVSVRLQTHVSAGVSERDMALAKEIERLASWGPPAASALTGARGKWIKGIPA